MMPERDPAVEWLVRDMRSHLRKRPKRHQLSDAGAYAFDLYETNTASMPTYELACKAGCGSCCAAHVGVEVAEAFAIVRHLHQTRTPDVFTALMARVAEIAAEVGELDPGTRWVKQVFCAFLDPDSQSCTIYPVRPLACRGYNSNDLDACNLSTANLDHDQPIPADAVRMLRAQQLRQALAEVTARMIDQDGMTDHAELHSALTAAHAADSELAWMRANKHG
ncbi:YkgJ family cysteine cluster protein [Magnetovibrio sp.]|uniref:YkgJ family cysteine cluster protein n=1 Tax=Magnetovibrio sp. TaxID=2024836 RepID=UPI002F933D35